MAEGQSSLLGKIIVVVAIVGCLYGAYYFLLKNPPPDDTDPQSNNGKPADSSQYKGNAVELGIAYGTEKKSWLEWAVQEFAKTTDGQKIKINLIPKGSQEGAQAIVAGD